MQNSTAEPRDVGGYYLTDNRQLPLKWQFPAGTVIPAQGYLVVYASGEDVRDPALDEQGRLHTNFQLSSGGEYLALHDAQGGAGFGDRRQFAAVSRRVLRSVRHGLGTYAGSHSRGAQRTARSIRLRRRARVADAATAEINCG